MTRLNVYDPALCCSTGVCGPEVDESLVRFAADLEWLKGRGVEVRRFDLAWEPGAFAANATVRDALTREGVSCLPLLMVGGEEIARGVYPTRSELARLTMVAGENPPPALRALPTDAARGCAAGSGCC
jgi:hypothetical protein